MTDKDRPRFVQLLRLLGEQYRETLSDIRQEVLFDGLADLSLAEVERAVRAHIRTSRFFPQVVELRELVTGNVKDQALVAFERIREEVRRVGYYGTPTRLSDGDRAMAEKVWGGWQRLCETLPAPGSDKYAFEQKRFIEAYDTHARLEPQDTPPQITRGDASRLLGDLGARGALRSVK